MEDFPDEILTAILCFTDLYELLMLMRVNKKYHGLVIEEINKRYQANMPDFFKFKTPELERLGRIESSDYFYERSTL